MELSCRISRTNILLNFLSITTYIYIYVVIERKFNNIFVLDIRQESSTNMYVYIYIYIYGWSREIPAFQVKACSSFQFKELINQIMDSS